MNIAQEEALTDWLDERHDVEPLPILATSTEALDLTHWSCAAECECNQPPF